jgi:sugar/nucleoside kinase (ribokinase family)
MLRPPVSPLQRLTALLRASRGRPLDVLGIGEISHDMVLQLPPPTALRAPLVDKLSAVALTTHGGGQIATAMVAAQRLGLHAGMCGAVGADAAGREQLAELAREGVTVDGVAVCPTAQTRLGILLVDADGDRRVIEWCHPELQPPADAPTPAVLQTTRAVHVDATYPAVSLRAARRAQATGTLISVDFDRARLADHAVLSELVALADLCVVSARFPSELTGEPDADRAVLSLSARTAGFVVVTRGAAGGVAVVDGTLRPFPALPPPALVDTTACGDTFHAALLTYLLERVEAAPDSAADLADPAAVWADAVIFASAAAALKCRDLGRRGCPTRAEVAAFLATSGRP